jgi:hypothetical protein
VIEITPSASVFWEPTQLHSGPHTSTPIRIPRVRQLSIDLDVLPTAADDLTKDSFEDVFGPALEVGPGAVDDVHLPTLPTAPDGIRDSTRPPEPVNDGIGQPEPTTHINMIDFLEFIVPKIKESSPGVQSEMAGLLNRMWVSLTP